MAAPKNYPKSTSEMAKKLDVRRGQISHYLRHSGKYVHVKHQRWEIDQEMERDLLQRFPSKPSS